jgi:hypothetical protein
VNIGLLIFLVLIVAVVAGVTLWMHYYRHVWAARRAHKQETENEEIRFWTSLRVDVRRYDARHRKENTNGNRS